MLTLTYGLKLPETGDLGSTFFPGLEDNITQIDGHNHNGSNSAAIPATSITKSSQTISSASWVATSGGTYRQEVTMPAGLTYDGVLIRFKISTVGSSEGEWIYPSLEKGTASNKYYVYINDNTLSLTALYV